MGFTAADVKNLREMTGVGMMDCKKALAESDGNIDKAIELSLIHISPAPSPSRARNVPSTEAVALTRMVEPPG